MIDKMFSIVVRSLKGVRLEKFARNEGISALVVESFLLFLFMLNFISAQFNSASIIVAEFISVY
jgi:hypothetical protein